MNQHTRLYVFTDELRRELSLAYAMRKHQRKAALDELVKRLEWPRHTFHCEARRMGLSTGTRRPWTAEEDRVLYLSAGETSIRKLARRLQRSHESVAARAFQLKLSMKLREGYDVPELMRIFGVSRPRVRTWIDKGMLGQPEIVYRGAVVSDEALVKFIRRNAEMLDWRLADQTFLKGVLLGQGKGISVETLSGIARGGAEARA